MASRKNDAFTRSMAAMIGANGADAIFDRYDKQHEFTTNILDKQQDLIEAQEEQIKFLGEIVVELVERVEVLETRAGLRVPEDDEAGAGA